MKRLVTIIVIPVVVVKATKLIREKRLHDRFVQKLENFYFSRQVNHHERVERRADRRDMRQAGLLLTGHNVDTGRAATSSGYFDQVTT